MAKEMKTNAMRILEKNKIPYELITYECKEFIDGVHTADLKGIPHEQSFKTIVMQGKTGAYYVFVLPVEKEVDRKLAAKAVGEKTLDMVPVKEINKVTGYIRGGCSPVGMKKNYMTVIDESAELLDQMYVSGGRIGTTLKLSPQQLQQVTRAVFAAITF